jgi:hypothetical protein
MRAPCRPQRPAGRHRTARTAADADKSWGPIRTGAFERADPDEYERLQFNTGGAYDLLIRGGARVMPGMPPLRADVAVNFDDAVARTGGRVREVGDLVAVTAIDTVDAANAFLHPRAEALAGPAGVGTGAGTGAGRWLTIGARAAIDLRDGAGAGAESKLLRRFE